MTAFILAQLILLLALRQRDSARQYVATVYAAVNLTHFAAFSWWLEGTLYFISAAAADVAIMALIVKAREVPPLGVVFLRVCLLELVLNTGAWIAWWNFADLAVYTAAYALLQVFIISRLARTERTDNGGGTTVANWFDYVRLVAHPGHSPIQRRHK